MEEESACITIREANRGNQARYSYEAFNSLTSPQCHLICKILSIVMLPGLILCGGITIFIVGCLVNISPMIIAGAAMFVVGILFCLLCGHVCDGLTTRVRKPARRARNVANTKRVAV